MYLFTQAFGSASSCALSVYLFSCEVPLGLNKCKLLRCSLLLWLFLFTSLMQKKSKKLCYQSCTHSIYSDTHMHTTPQKKGIKFNKRAPEME